MSKEEKDSRSNKEISAEIAKTEAETRKILAEALKAEAEADKVTIEAEAAKRSKAREEATDERNYLYRFSGSVSTSTVSSCMMRLTQWSRQNPKCDIEIVFSSPGGSIIDGFELFDFIQELRNKGHHVTTGTLGMAASMAGILLQAGDDRWVGHQAWVMIHRAHFGAMGKTYEVEDEVEFVKRIEERILDIFTARSKLTKQKIKRNWDRKDWWISADEALELSLVDEIRAMMPEVKPKSKTKLKRKKSSKK
ncbi:MAG: ATP-dependent Clp protease proteolytic subunit [Rhodobacteraceae bacterium]|nr:ATP-dependent Clp protease proteolytic subunit [Paracoccaceae bacterium]